MNTIVIFCAQYLFIGVGLGVLIAWWLSDRPAKLQFTATTLLACACAVVLAKLAGHLYYDPRPFVTEHITPLILHTPDNGFPSDHALLTMTLTAVTYFFNKRISAVLLVLTLLVGAARVMANVHSPLDIAAGWLLGIAGAVVGYYAVRYALALLHDRAQK